VRGAARTTGHVTVTGASRVRLAGRRSLPTGRARIVLPVSGRGPGQPGRPARRWDQSHSWRMGFLQDGQCWVRRGLRESEPFVTHGVPPGLESVGGRPGRRGSEPFVTHGGPPELVSAEMVGGAVSFRATRDARCASCPRCGIHRSLVESEPFVTHGGPPGLVSVETVGGAVWFRATRDARCASCPGRGGIHRGPAGSEPLVTHGGPPGWARADRAADNRLKAIRGAQRASSVARWNTRRADTGLRATRCAPTPPQRVQAGPGHLSGLGQPKRIKASGHAVLTVRVDICHDAALAPYNPLNAHCHHPMAASRSADGRSASVSSLAVTCA
jgi:hypothetical protein